MRAWAMTMLFLFACDAAETQNAPPPNEAPPIGDDWTKADPTPQGPAVLTPEETAAGKEARRMSVDQLRRSIPELFGGETWTLSFGRDLTGNAFDLLARTLGEPDYIGINDENVEPSPLFAKYMDDMAGDVCGKAIARDVQGTGEKLVIVEDDVDANLRYLRLKLHGIYVADGTLDGIEDLRGLYDAILAESDEPTAWFGVCVAMLTAPEMMAY